MYCTIYVAKTNVLISCAATTQLIWVFVFANAKIRFSHDGAQLQVNSGRSVTKHNHFCEHKAEDIFL